MPSALADAAAGAALAIALAAVADIASLATGGRAATWGPVVTLAATAAVVIAGLPSAALIEGGLASARRRTAGAAALAYLAATLAWGLMLWVGWRLAVDEDVTPVDLATEYALIAAGFAVIWLGARGSQHRRPALVTAPSAVVIAALAALALVAG